MKTAQILQCNLPLKGKRICLQRLSPTHAKALQESFANKKFWSSYRANQDTSPERLIDKLQFEYERLPAQVGKIEWIIQRAAPTRDLTNTSDCEDQLQLRPLGLASLSAINTTLSSAELLVGFFDRKDAKAGLGLESSLLVLSYAFNHEKLHSLKSFVYANNIQAQRNTLALGFTNEALLKQKIRVGNNGDFLDVYQNRMLADDFRNNSRLARLSRRLLDIDVTTIEDANPDILTAPKGSAEISASFKIEK